jgi:Arc/MetJ family transcription regulator
MSYILSRWYILLEMGKHLVDIDEEALRAARARLGTETIKETVNRALRRAAGSDERRVKRSLDALARAELAAREDAWR